MTDDEDASLRIGLQTFRHLRKLWLGFRLDLGFVEAEQDAVEHGLAFGGHFAADLGRADYDHAALHHARFDDLKKQADAATERALTSVPGAVMDRAVDRKMAVAFR